MTDLVYSMSCKKAKSTKIAKDVKVFGEKHIELLKNIFIEHPWIVIFSITLRSNSSATISQRKARKLETDSFETVLAIP